MVIFCVRRKSPNWPCDAMVKCCVHYKYVWTGTRMGESVVISIWIQLVVVVCVRARFSVEIPYHNIAWVGRSFTFKNGVNLYASTHKHCGATHAHSQRCASPSASCYILLPLHQHTHTTFAHRLARTQRSNAALSTGTAHTVRLCRTKASELFFHLSMVLLFSVP